MAENETLLQAVLADPDSDEPRLAYAQWCDKQEDEATKARGELIRAQVALANGSLDDDFRKASGLRQQASSLLSRYQSKWGQPLAEMVQAVRFDRGFVECVTLPAARFLELADQLFALAPVRHLDLTAVKPVARQLFSSPHLKNIRSLELDHCGLGDPDLSFLARSPHVEQLRWLSISNNRAGVSTAEAFARSPHLKNLAYVDFRGNLIEPNEGYSYDNGLVVDSGLPKAGRELEARLGPLPWLHHPAKSVADAIPDRFRIKPAPSASSV